VTGCARQMVRNVGRSITQHPNLFGELVLEIVQSAMYLNALLLLKVVAYFLS
jgi:hypothetical protein